MTLINSLSIQMVTKAISVLLALMTVIGSLVYLFGGQKTAEEHALSSGNQDILLSSFSPAEPGDKAQLRRVIDSTHPLNIVNHYGGEPVTDLWASIPENQRPFTVILLFAGNSLLSDGTFQGLEENTEICEANHIPYAIQIISGETHNEARLPVAYLENRFAKQHRYFYGVDAAELYNGVSWRGEIESNNSQYIIDCINMVVKYGAYFFWTDTNMNYDSGMLLQWLESNEAFYSAFKNNAQNIVLMNKESYGDPSSYSVMQGLWLSGLVGNWGVSSDWWHWQVDGDKKSLFGEFDQYVDDAWDMILSYPENMYVQSMMLVMSCGGTCFLAEAPNFSTSSGGIPIAGFHYGISPLLNAVISGEITIPGKNDVLRETTAAVLGKSNYPEFNYNFSESNLYPCTGRYRILPLLPANLRLAERAVFENNGITLIEEEKDQPYYDSLFKQEAIGDTYAMRTANEWFYINNMENARATKSASMFPALCSAQSFSISTQEHTSAIITEKSDGLAFYLSNYRTDKTNMVKTITPELRKDKNWIEICKMFMVIDANGNPVGLDDSIKRTTVITVKGTLNGGKPQIVWRSNPDGSGYQNRPFSYTEDWNSETGTLTLTIHHNGVVKFDFLIDKSNKTLNTAAKPPIAPTLKSNCHSVKDLQTYVDSLAVADKSHYNYYSYLQFNAALEKAKVIISERTYSVFDIYAAQIELETAYKNLLELSKYVALIKTAKTLDVTGAAQENKTQLSLAIDALLREMLSSNLYVPGRSNQLEYTKTYKNARFNKQAKTLALERKYKDLQAAMDVVS